MGETPSFTYMVHRNNDTINESVTNMSINIYQGYKSLGNHYIRMALHC